MRHVIFTLILVLAAAAPASAVELAVLTAPDVEWIIRPADCGAGTRMDSRDPDGDCVDEPTALTPLVEEDFTGTPPQYGFGGIYGGEGGAQWSEAQTTDLHGVGSQLTANQGEDQFDFGWFNGAGKTWGSQETMYIRFKLRFDPSYRWDGSGSQQNKLYDITGGGDSRIIVHNERSYDPTTPSTLSTSDYGSAEFGSFAIKRGIDYNNATNAVAVTYGAHYAVQAAVTPAPSSGQGAFKLYVNNNDEADPNEQNLSASITSDNWGQIHLGGFWTDVVSSRDSILKFYDFELDDEFDPNWHTGIGEVEGKKWLPQFNGDPEDTAGNATAAGWTFDDLGNTDLSIQSGTGPNGQTIQFFRAPLTSDDVGTTAAKLAEKNTGDFVNVGDPQIEETLLDFWVRFSSGISTWPSSTHKLAVQNLYNGSDNQRRYQVYLFVDDTGEYAVDYVYDPDNVAGERSFNLLSQNQGTPDSVQGDTWTRLRLYTRWNTPGSSDGEVKLWIDDGSGLELELAHSNLNLRQDDDFGVGRLILGPYATDSWQDSGSNYHDWAHVNLYVPSRLHNR